MQPDPGFLPPAASASKPASITLFRLAVASILCWAIAPAGLIAGLLSRRDSLRRGEPVKGHAWLAIVLGGIGTAIMLAAYLSDAIPAWLSHDRPKPVVASATRPALASASPPAAPSGPTEGDQQAMRARAAAAVQTATELLSDKTRLEASMASTDKALAAKQFGTVRRTFDGLWSSLGAVDPTTLVPGDDADAATRATLSAAGLLLDHYQQLRKAVDASEMAVFDVAFNTLWDPKNAQKDEGQLYSSIGKRFGLTGAEVQAIYRRNESEADRRLKVRGDVESLALRRFRR
jgi:hypothetical protein